MDHDLLDLSILDDPDPPEFGALRAEEAVRRSARHQAHRARAVAVAVLAVIAVAGIGFTSTGEDQSTAIRDTALPPPVEPEVSTTLPFATTPSPGLPDPAAGAAAAPTETTVATVPSGPTTTATPAAPTSPTVSPSGPVGGAPAMAPTTARPPAQATSQPPEGTVAAPAGLRFTLSVEGGQIPIGGSARGVIRFENSRSTPVTLAGGGCSTMWRANLYEAGQPVPRPVVTCPMRLTTVVAAGAVEVAEVQVQADPALRPGTYEAYATISVEEDGAFLHTERVVVTVVRP